MSLGFGNPKATADNVQLAMEEAKPSEGLLKKATSACCGLLADNCCGMCVLQTCRFANDQCMIVCTQLCVAMACFDLSSCCIESCECCTVQKEQKIQGGVVRLHQFEKFDEARTAVKVMNGRSWCGRKLHVAISKYRKYNSKGNWVKSSSFKDHKKYARGWGEELIIQGS
ncbi:hypothetical protein PIB30_022701 [Stylosanthes scabra]|uniref:RRM domain-containing protein n=1 Tax=Stylosanthes scabra TaxID=79078 RepID=A0ABU6X9W9_9FABA|nr:hypothetical protein [Stylosanthes scabra]